MTGGLRVAIPWESKGRRGVSETDL
jgi:hypothetical protein